VHRSGLLSAVPHTFGIAVMSLFRPVRPDSSSTFRLLRHINQRHAQDLHTYHDLYVWSCSHLDLFWSAVWDQSNILGHKGPHVIDTMALPAHNPTWYPNLHLLFISFISVTGLPMPVSIGQRTCCIVARSQSWHSSSPVRHLFCPLSVIYRPLGPVS
jgi:hypothetical protein